MKRVIKKVLSVTTAIILAMSVLPTAAYAAATNSDEKSSPVIEATANSVAVEKVILNMAAKTLKVKGIVQLKATVSPTNASNTKVTWTSSDPSVAKVSKTGKVTALKKGKATITATSNNGKKAKAAILVDSSAIAVKGVTLNRTVASLEAGLNLVLLPTLNPKSPKTKDVIWSTDNKKVATVGKDGVVTGKAAGTAKITAMTKDGGKKASCVVTVFKGDAATKALWSKFLAGDNTVVAGTWEDGNGNRVTIRPNGTFTLNLGGNVIKVALSQQFKDSKQVFAPCVVYGASLGEAGIMFVPSGQELLVWNNSGKVQIVKSDKTQIRMVGPTQIDLHSSYVNSKSIYYRVSQTY